VRSAYLRSLEPFRHPESRSSACRRYDEMKGLIDLVGRAVALEILLEGRVVRREEAKDKGLVNPRRADGQGRGRIAGGGAAHRDGAPLGRALHKKFARRLAIRARRQERARRSYACYDTEDFKIGSRRFSRQAEAEFRGNKEVRKMKRVPLFWF